MTCSTIAALCFAGATPLRAGPPLLHWQFGAARAAVVSKAAPVFTGKLPGVKLGAAGAMFAGNAYIEATAADNERLVLGRDRDLSITLWLAVPAPPATGDEFTFVCKGDRGSNPRLLLKMNSEGRVSLRLGAQASVTAEGRIAIADGKWHHIAAVLDRDRATQLYVDGKPDGTADKTDTIDFRTTSPLTVGRSYQQGSGARRYLRGFIGSVSLFDHALGADAVTTLAATTGGLPAAASLPKLPASGKPQQPRAKKRRAGGKKQHPQAISRIVDGQADQVLPGLAADADATPDRLESLFALAVAYAQTGAVADSARCVRQAVELGLPFERFLAGPRDLLAPLLESAEFRAIRETNAVELLHGPMLGCVTADAVSVWVRTAHAVPVQVVARAADGTGAQVMSQPVSTSADADYTAVARITGLRAATEYSYRLRVNNVDLPAQRRFRTLPARGSKAALRIAFGGGAGYNPQYERMWTTIAAAEPMALLLLGDNVYIDNPTRPAVQRYCYYRRQSRPEFRELVGACPVYAIWDDHDFTTNDQRGGPELDKPDWKIPVYRLFRSQWNNPGYGGGDTQPGCWFATTLGDVDLIMLDGRYYREDPKEDAPSMLGPAQKAWLLETLKAATGTFKLLASPVPWAKGTKPGSRDTWDGYAAEREEIFAFLEQNRIEGVVLLSADRHRSDVWKIPREAGYDLYEFESSCLSNVHRHGPIRGALFSYNAKCSFGLLSFDLAAADPELTYSIVNIDGETVHTHSVCRSQLRRP